MEDNEKVIVNFVNENNGKRHELEIPLNITAKALVTALNKAYNPVSYTHLDVYKRQVLERTNASKK